MPGLQVAREFSYSHHRTSNSSLTSLDQGQASSSVIHEDKYTELAVKKSRIEEHMLELSQSFSGIEVDFLKELIQNVARMINLYQLDILGRGFYHPRCLDFRPPDS